MNAYLNKTKFSKTQKNGIQNCRLWGFGADDSGQTGVWGGASGSAVWDPDVQTGGKYGTLLSWASHLLRCIVFICFFFLSAFKLFAVTIPAIIMSEWAWGGLLRGFGADGSVGRGKWDSHVGAIKTYKQVDAMARCFVEPDVCFVDFIFWQPAFKLFAVIITAIITNERGVGGCVAGLNIREINAGGKKW